MVVSYASSADALVSGDLDYQLLFAKLYQGDATPMYVSLTSYSTNNIFIKWIGIQFDWMPSSEWLSKDFSSNPIMVGKSGGTADFGQFDLVIPQNLIAGEHELHIRIRYDEEHLFWWTYDDYWSEYYSIEIHSIKERQYLELKPTVFQSLTEAVEKAYWSPSANELLQQAKDKYDEAPVFEGQENWDEAYEALLLTQSLLERVVAEETNYKFLILVGVIVAIVVVVIVIVIYVGRKR